MEGEDVVDGAAEIAGAELLVALEQEARAEQQDDGEADFRSEERLAQTSPAATAAVRARGALQRFEKLPGMQAERRDETGGQTGDDGNGDDKGERPEVEVNL